MKAHIRTHAVVANPRHGYGYVRGLRPGLGVNASLSFCPDTSVSEYQPALGDARHFDSCQLNCGPCRACIDATIPSSAIQDRSECDTEVHAVDLPAPMPRLAVAAGASEAAGLIAQFH